MSGLLVNPSIFFFYNITDFFLPFHFKSKISVVILIISAFVYSSCQCIQKTVARNPLPSCLTVWAAAIPFSSYFDQFYFFPCEIQSSQLKKFLSTFHLLASFFYFLLDLISVCPDTFSLELFYSFLIILSLCMISFCIPCLEISHALSSKTTDYYLSNYCSKSTSPVFFF